MNIFDLQGTIKLDTSDYDSKLSTTEQSITGFAGKLTGASNTVQGLGAKISGAGKAIAGISVPVGAAMTVATKSAMDFGDSVAKVSTIADESVMSYDDLSKGILQLSNETGRGAGELAEAMYQALSASVDTGHALEFTQQASNLAKAGFLETSDAVDVLTTVINAYGMEASDATKIADQLVQVQNDGKTTVNELASAMGQVIPTASALNIPLEQLNASYAVLTKQGINTANTTTYLRGMFNELADSGSTVSSILQQETGKSFGELMNSGATLGDVMGILNDSVDGNSEAFLNLWGNTRAGQGALALLNGGIDEFNEETEKMKNSTGNVADALDKLNTPAAQARKAMTQLKNAGIEIGSALLPAVAKVAQGISKMIGAFQKLPAPVKSAIGVIGGIVGALSPVLMIGGKLVSGVGKIIGLIPMIAGGVQTVIGVLSIINPVVLGVIVAIAAVIAVVKNWGTITDWLKGVWESFTSWFSGIWDGIASAVSGVWDSVVTAAQGAWDTVTNIIQVAVMFIQEIIGLFAGIFQGIWAQIWNYIGEPVTTAFNAVSTFIGGILSAIGNAISSAWSAISSTTSSIFSSIANFISTIWNNIRNTVSTIAQAVVTAVQGAWSALSGIASSIWNSVVSAVQTAFSPVQQKVATIVDTVKNKLETAWGTVSGTVSGIFEGIKNAMTKPVETARDKIKGAIDKIKGFFDVKIQGPKISLPSISVSGKFSLNPPSVPHFSLSWHKDAYDNPLLFTSPTVLGAHGFGDKAGGGGELVVGRNNLMNWITEAMAKGTTTFASVMQNIGNAVINSLNKIADITEIYGEKLTTFLDALIEDYRKTNNISNDQTIWNADGTEIIEVVSDGLSDGAQKAKEKVASMFDDLFNHGSDEDISGEAVADAMEDIQENVLPSLEEMFHAFCDDQFFYFEDHVGTAMDAIMDRQEEDNAVLKSIDSHLVSTSSRMVSAMTANAKPSIGTVTININGGKDDAETIANKVNAIIMKQYQVKRAYA